MEGIKNIEEIGLTLYKKEEEKGEIKGGGGGGCNGHCAVEE